MKKYLALILLIMICLFQITACKSKTEDNVLTDVVLDMTNENEKVSINDTNTEISVDAFMDKVNGFWGQEEADGSWTIFHFENAKVNMYTYAGPMWLSNGNIEKIEKIPDNILKVTVSYKEISYDDETSNEAKKDEYSFKSTDDYKRNLIFLRKDNVEVSYTYLGKTQEEIDAYIGDRMSKQSPPAPYSENAYTNKPQKEVINDTKLCSMAFEHFSKMASELKYELRKEIYTATASAVYPPKIVSRTDQLVTIEGKINYWFKGGNPDGSYRATVVYDKYTGAVVMDNIN